MGPWGSGTWCGGWQMGGFFMMLMMAAFWGLVIFGGISLFRWFARSSQKHGQPSGSAALEQLKLRYVNGEISKEEFEQMKKDIQ